MISSTSKPTVLVTNDDGIDSIFLRILVDVLASEFNVYVAAPLSEQSWIGRAMTRHKKIAVESRTDWPGQAWAIEGTPTDCVNIALGHLLDGNVPQLVLSGINLGYNTTLPLIYSSGTVAGALEGAVWGIPSVAVSQALKPENFVQAYTSGSHSAPELIDTVKSSARHTREFCLKLLQKPHEAASSSLIVHNLNFPDPCFDATEWRQTVPSAWKPAGQGFYQRCEDPDQFEFQYQRGKVPQGSSLTDREVIESGDVSWSVLNFSGIGAL